MLRKFLGNSRFCTIYIVGCLFLGLFFCVSGIFLDEELTAFVDKRTVPPATAEQKISLVRGYDVPSVLSGDSSLSFYDTEIYASSTITVTYNIRFVGEDCGRNGCFPKYKADIE